MTTLAVLLLRRTHLVHDDGAVNGQFEVGQRRLDDRQHFAHAVNLLTQEDVERLQVTHLLQPLSNLHTIGHVTLTTSPLTNII